MAVYIDQIISDAKLIGIKLSILPFGSPLSYLPQSIFGSSPHIPYTLVRLPSGNQFPVLSGDADANRLACRSYAFFLAQTRSFKHTSTAEVYDTNLASYPDQASTGGGEGVKVRLKARVKVKVKANQSSTI